MTDYSAMSEEELREAERDIARRHLNKFPTFTVTWGLANVACWLALWPLLFTGTIPLWAGFVIACFNFLLFYLPSHEAQHSIIARPGEKLRWFNEFVGHVCSTPLVIPYRVLRATHMEHHKYTNDPELDPDYTMHADSAPRAIWSAIQWQQPKPFGKEKSYSLALQRLERPDLMLESAAYQLIYYAILFTLAWSGYAIEAALLWWAPRHLALIWVLFYLAWAPHNPGLPTGRYGDTRSFRSIFGNLGSLGMQYHIVHHLYPRIPLYRTPAAYREMKPVIEALGGNVREL